MDGRIDAVLSRLEAAERRIVAHIDERLASATSLRTTTDGEEGAPAVPAGTSPTALGPTARDKEQQKVEDRKRLKERPQTAEPLLCSSPCPTLDSQGQGLAGASCGGES